MAIPSVNQRRTWFNDYGTFVDLVWKSKLSMVLHSVCFIAYFWAVFHVPESSAVGQVIGNDTLYLSMLVYAAIWSYWIFMGCFVIPLMNDIVFIKYLFSDEFKAVIVEIIERIGQEQLVNCGHIQAAIYQQSDLHRVRAFRSYGYFLMGSMCMDRTGFNYFVLNRLYALMMREFVKGGLLKGREGYKGDKYYVYLPAGRGRKVVGEYYVSDDYVLGKVLVR